MCRRWTASTLRSTRAKPWGWWANRGCGKTTTSKLILRLEEPTGGAIYLDGQDISEFRGSEMKEYRTQVQAVFQDPWSSLSPRMRVRDIVSEALVVNRKVTSQEKNERVEEVLSPGRPPPRPGRPLPPRIQRRAAAAGGRRQRPGLLPQADYPRRTRFGPGCVHPRPGDEPAGGFAAGNRRRLSAGGPQPGDRALYGASKRR